MRLSIVVSTQPASFNALAYSGELSETLTKIEALGFDGVELAVRDPAVLDFEALAGLLKRLRLPVAAIGTGQAYGEEGLSLTDGESAIRQRAAERISAQLRLGADLGALVIIGLVRGKSSPSLSPRKVELLLVEALRELAGERPEVRLAIEPINRYETDLINTVGAGLRLLEKIGMENVGLLLDTFHMNIEEIDMTRSIQAAGDRLFHFHVADSNRWYPGAGHIDFKEILGALESVSYRGFVSAEILPLPDPDTAAERTVKTIRESFSSVSRDS